MEILSHQLQKLEVLDLTYCMRITVHVLEHLTNLKQLHTGVWLGRLKGLAVFVEYYGHTPRRQQVAKS